MVIQYPSPVTESSSLKASSAASLLQERLLDWQSAASIKENHPEDGAGKRCEY
jgi:hypothetical protein